MPALARLQYLKERRGDRPPPPGMSYFKDDPTANSSEDNMTDLTSDLLNNSNMTVTDNFILISFFINIYFTPVLVILGTVGNLLSIIVFFKSKLRAQSTSQYLSALAISDTVCLLQLIPPWLKAVRASLIFGKEGFCQCFVFLTYVSSSSSSWLVVTFTVERFVAVLYPLQRTRMCSVRRARLLIAAIVVSCATINTPVLKFAVPKGNDCNIDYDLMDHAARFNVVDTIFSFTLPLSIITVLNIWIMIGVCRLSQARGHMIKQQDSCRHMSALARRTLFLLQRSQQRITRMLLIVSSVFVLLNLPAYTMRIVAYAKNMSSYEYSGRWAALQQICLLFFNTNFGINFFLYCMTGQNFRRAFCDTFPWCERTRNRAAARWSGGRERAPPPHPSVTSSLSINTEASTCAGASRLSLAKPCTGLEPTYRRRRKGSAYASYPDLWRVKQSFYENNKPQQYEMQEFSVRSILYPSSPPERPVPRWPQNSISTNFPAPVRSAPPRATSFRPIRYDLVPGQVAPHHLTAIINQTQMPDTQDSPLETRRHPVQDRTSPQSGDRSSDELEGFAMRASPPNRRPQPCRKFSLPTRKLKKFCPVDREETSPPRRPTPIRGAPEPLPPATLGLPQRAPAPLPGCS